MNQEFDITITTHDLLELEKLMAGVILEEDLDHAQFQMVRTLKALQKFLKIRRINPQFEIELKPTRRATGKTEIL